MKSPESIPPEPKKLADDELLFSMQDDDGCLEVLQQGDRRILRFGSSLEQSSLPMSRPWHLNHEYTQIMLLGLVLHEVQHLTVLGLGGGGLAHCLEYYMPEKRRVFIERRQAVIDIARDWFDLPESDAMQVHCADACDYLLSAEAASTELILSDLYEAGGMSEVQAQLVFVEQAQRNLTGNGWLVINYHQPPEADSPLMQCLRREFVQLGYCDVFRGNWILFCGKAAPEFDIKQQSQRAKQLAQQLEMPMLYYFKQLKWFD